MPPDDRFNRIESASPALPASVKKALSKMDRFGHLEIGELKSEQVSPKAAPAATDRVLCSHCGQPNEPLRDICWACYKPLKAETPSKPEPDQDIQLILDGTTYKSSDANVPHDIRMLMDRIREEGYSEELLREWREWRSTRNTPLPTERPFESAPAHDASAVKGQRISVLRIDGKVYQSDDPKLSPEIRELFDHIEKNGVTPELLNHLRQHGDKVKFRPHTTPQPSDGDIDFWRSVGERTLDTLTTPLPTGGYGSSYRYTTPFRYRTATFTFKQHLISLAISIGVPAAIVIWIYWHYIRTIGDAIGK